MRSNPLNKNSIAFKLAVILIVSVIVQCLFMSAIFMFSDVIGQARKSSFFSFSRMVTSRKGYLEAEMNNVWKNFSEYPNQISNVFYDYNEKTTTRESVDKYLEDAAPYLINLLRYTKTTGAFLILNDNIDYENTYSALYIRDFDPKKNSADNSDLSLMAGPWNVCDASSIVTNEKWSYKLKLTDENSKFYKKPYENISLSNNESLLGYWSAPFSLTGDDKKIITYSIPLKNELGEPIGVLGIEVAIDYLYKFLPPTDLQPQDSLGYMIGIRDGQQKILPLISSGAMQSRTLNLNEPLDLTKNKYNKNIYLINNHNSEKVIYASINTIGLYYNNTPFDDEHWYLIGLMEAPTLLSFPHKLRTTILISLLFCLCFGILNSIGASKWFTKPIKILAKEVNNRKHLQGIASLNKTGLSEIDDLSSAIDISQNRLIEISSTLSRIIDMTNIPFGAFEIKNDSSTIFATSRLAQLLNIDEPLLNILCNDKYKFNSYLKALEPAQLGDPEIYCIKYDNTSKWIRINQTKTPDGILGIIMDITTDVLQTISIKLERDNDSLTGIRNRTAYQQMLFSISSQLNISSVVGLGVFDLNGLKIINDHYGHTFGDEYIKSSSKIICESFPHCPVFRIGGDEFVAIFQNMEKETVETMHENMLAQIAAKNQTTKIKIGIAFGYSFYDHASDICIDDVFTKADNNMYINKEEMKKV